ncbi:MULTISPECIES: GNAT family N-acetyltransferase [Streptosporangium]|uniref:GNAT superfamily N-acetyltransferase n=1 Tax=Streptosporangium brasiliense TaxID=47480 RepID=A0ABT9RFD9_9ACTN|nr:GNAT family N-acetyltransferase [Streptosporangium brasiliense]MDP9867561.1 GNAT superfamily N-acetyltransferase [Streptosporangium brasiliense]
MTASAERAGVIVVRAVAWDDAAAVALREAMEEEMGARYADRLASKVDYLPRGMNVEPGSVVYTGVAYLGADLPVGHIALRRLGAELELKRMFVVPSHRGAGVARPLLAAAEDAARALGGRRIILQTGDRQPDAVRVYRREGYVPIPVFPPYERLEGSCCFEKRLA